MVTYMNDKKLQGLEDVRIFLAGTLDVEFSIQRKDARYDWIEQTLRRFRYRALGRGDRSVILRYLERVSGYSRQTVTRPGGAVCGPGPGAAPATDGGGLCSLLHGNGYALAGRVG